MTRTAPIECPKCEGISVESVPLLYRSLTLKEPGRGLLAGTQVLLFADRLKSEEKKTLLKELAPPPEIQSSLPAPNIALMAFLLSWLATSSYFIAKMGHQVFSAMSLLLGLALAIPFYLILRVVTHDFGKSSERQKERMQCWEKSYFCKNCGNIFIPKTA